MKIKEKNLNEKTKTIKTKKLEYNDIVDIVEELVKIKSRSYSFDIYEYNDIAQEIRIICFNVLSKFDPTKVGSREKWKNFFGRCVDNGLKNLKRDNYIRSAFPYRKQLEKLEADDKSEEAKKIRKLWAKFQGNIKAKLGIIHAKSLSAIGFDVVKHDRFSLEMEYKDQGGFLIEKAF